MIPWIIDESGNVFPGGDKFDPFVAFRKRKAFERETFLVVALANTVDPRLKFACWLLGRKLLLWRVSKI